MQEVFLGYPFSLDHTLKYRERLRAICEKANFKLTTADDRYAPEQIWDAIQEAIQNSWYCIFDLTNLNSNVLLELGYAIGSDQDVIILQSRTKISSTFGSKLEYAPLPTDLRSIRVIQYESFEHLELQLLKAFQDMETDEHEDDRFALSVMRLLKNGAKSTKEIVTEVDRDLNFSYQMTRNRLESLHNDGLLNKQYKGREALYSLPR